MAKGLLTIYCGDGHGKSGAAIGRAVQAVTEGKNVVIIQFLKGKGLGESAFLKRMEPEIKLFRFEKSNENFEKLSENKKKEETANIRNGINFAKKVLATGECELLVLDEVLGLVSKGIVEVEQLESILKSRDNTSVILTGVHLPDPIRIMADEVFRIETVKSGVLE